MSENGKLLSELLNGRTLSSLANEMSISISNLSRVLNGKGCTKKMAERLNNYFRISKGGFVEEKRDYAAERKPKEDIKKINTEKVDIEKCNKILRAGEKQLTKRLVPKYEKGEFVLYKDGRVGQIKKAGYNPQIKNIEYGVRLVEWCRPKEYADHHIQYNILDPIAENDIQIIKKDEILFYKNKYENIKTYGSNENKFKNSVNNIIDKMTNDLKLENDLLFRNNLEKEKVNDLIKSWTETDLQTKSDLTSDEKLMILKQIIYKLLTII